MIIRKATETDESEILEVVRKSMSEGVTFDNTIWWHKHKFNPFGASVIYVAKIEQKIVGVRAFMQWQWQVENQTYRALRAVDTVTLPEHRGKGVFSKLTLEVIKVEGQHFDFIFNTPNRLSKPGYLKMGWKVVNNIKFNLSPIIQFYFLKNNKSFFEENLSIEKIETLLHNHNTALEKTGKLFTPKYVDFLKWRYENNPIQKYELLIQKDFFIACYVKKHKYFNELRVSEMIFETSNYKTKRIIKKLLTYKAKENRCNIITFANVTNFKKSIRLKLGPQLTLKHLSNNDGFFMQLENWNYSLGDLELY